MSTIVDKQIADAERKLTALLRDVDQEVFARVQAWTAKMANGAKLSDFLYDEKSPVAHRVTTVRSLIDILEAKDYARLPEVEAKPKRKEKEPVVVNSWNEDGGLVERVAIADEIRAHDAAIDAPLPPPSDEHRELVRQEVRLQLASILETIAKVLRDSK